MCLITCIIRLVSKSGQKNGLENQATFSRISKYSEKVGGHILDPKISGTETLHSDPQLGEVAYTLWNSDTIHDQKSEREP